MKKTIYNILFVLTISIISTRTNAQIQASTQEYAVSIKIDPPNKPSKIYLMISETVDSSATIANGRYEFNGVLKHPERASVVITFSNDQENVSVPIFLNSGKIEIKLDSALNAKVSGNKLAADYYDKIARPVQIFNKKIWQLKLENGNAYMKKSADTVAITKRLVKVIDNCYNVPRTFIKENPKSILSIGALYYMGQGKSVGEVITLNDLEQMYLSLDSPIRNSPYGKKYAAQLAKWKEERAKN